MLSTLATSLLVLSMVPAPAPGQVKNLTTGVFYNSLGAAIASAVPDDTLEIDDTGYTSASPLILNENVVITLDGLQIVTKSNAYPPQVKLDGTGLSGSVVAFDGAGLTTGTLIQGIRISNGSGTTVGGRKVGGGIACLNGASPTIRNCVVNFNNADDGAGIYVSLGATSQGARIMRDSITFNTATNDGGGVYVELLPFLETANAPQISRVRIAGNTAGASGGGLYASTGTTPSMTHSWVDSNQALGSVGGGVCFNGTFDASIDSSMLRENQSAFDGGGLAIIDGIGTDVQHTTISLNESLSGSGGGIYDLAWDPMSFGPSVFRNDLVIDNTAAVWGGGLRSEGLAPSMDFCTFSLNAAALGGGISHNGLTLSHSILWGDTQSSGGEIHSAGTATVSASDVQGGFAGPNVINVDPKFASGTVAPCAHAVLDDYHLTQTANACVDFLTTSVPPDLLVRSTNPNHAIHDAAPADLGFHYPGAGCP